MKYRLIQMVDGQMVKTEGDISNVVAAMEVLGYELKGLKNNPRQRTELQGMPIFEGLHGPMWDGDAIRYEDRASYELLSA